MNPDGSPGASTVRGAPARPPYRMTPKEIAWGWVAGGADGGLPAQPSSVGTPRQALEEAILPALLHPPCVVEFSGGRDSSVVLAVAQRLAHREGIAPPVAFTRRYGALEEADEDQWQEMVIKHLEVADWERRTMGAEVDLVGPIAGPSLLRWGVLWPPPVHTRAAEMELAKGGSLLSGEGGDKVLGRHRFSLLTQLLRRAVPISATNLRELALALAPSAVRRERFRRHYQRSLDATWLRPGASHEFIAALAADAAAEPADWRRAVREYPRTRGVRLGMETLERLAAESGVTRVDPLLAGPFLDALCRAGGRLGFVGRTAALRTLFGDLLPDAVLARQSKARFNRAMFNEHSRAFVEGWTGKGADPELVDPEALRAIWMTPEPHAMTFPLLQACWLASRTDAAHA
jgi:asparagine synthetase B (glutamine-hydrolysing)